MLTLHVLRPSPSTRRPDFSRAHPKTYHHDPFPFHPRGRTYGAIDVPLRRFSARPSPPSPPPLTSTSPAHNPRASYRLSHPTPPTPSPH